MDLTHAALINLKLLSAHRMELLGFLWVLLNLFANVLGVGLDCLYVDTLSYTKF